MTNPARRLDGSRILVVGAGTQPSDDPDAPMGNGRAISVRCAHEGAEVICADRDEASAAETVALIEADGGAARVLVGDVGNPQDCEDLIAAVTDRPLHGLVGNVGIGRGGRLEATSVQDWDTVMAVNLRAQFLLAKHALPVLEDGGAFVFISSVAGLRPGSHLPAYDASKAGVIGLSRHVALEGSRRGIRSNVVAPGLIDTPLGRWATRGRPSRARTPVPLGRHGTAWEIAAAVTFLLSADASYITGQVLAVDGGLTMM